MVETTWVFHNPEDLLPEDGEYVLAWFPYRPWKSSESKGKHFFKVVQFHRGISLEERKRLSDEDDRKWTFKFCDEEAIGNNKVPYAWDEFGPGDFFGQECAMWAHLPDIYRVRGANESNS